MPDTTSMSPAEFFQRCAEHDWFHEHSDSHGVWRAGDAERRRIEDAVCADPSLRPIYDAWYGWFLRCLTGDKTAVRPVADDFVPPVSTLPAVEPLPYRDGSPHPDQLSLDA